LVISGASSGSTQVRGRSFSFAVICFPHAMQPARSHESLFPIIGAQVGLRQRQARKNLGSKLKVQSAFIEGFVALRAAVDNSHPIIVLTLNQKQGHFLLVRKSALAR
jgi:hypothetical protein